MEYIGVKMVKAEAMTHGEFCEHSGKPCDGSPGQEGYIVRYEEGYESWCPKDVFEKHNRRAISMPFGHAIEAARQGRKIARHGWHSKDMFVVVMPAMYLPPFNSQEPGKKVNDRTAKIIGEDAPLDCQSYFAMYDAEKRWIPGWLASQTDMLSDDWFIVE